MGLKFERLFTLKPTNNPRFYQNFHPSNNVLNVQNILQLVSINIHFLRNWITWSIKIYEIRNFDVHFCCLTEFQFIRWAALNITWLDFKACFTWKSCYGFIPIKSRDQYSIFNKNYETPRNKVYISLWVTILR